jgi:5'-deoxynucleotidase YfbR-like HD superfamily hydrolase
MLKELPEQERRKLYDSWIEYEKRECYEAKVVKALDALESLFQVYEYRHVHVFSNHLKFTIEYGERFSHVDPFIEKFVQFVTTKMRNEYKAFKVTTRSQRKSE